MCEEIIRLCMDNMTGAVIPLCPRFEGFNLYRIYSDNLPILIMVCNLFKCISLGYDNVIVAAYQINTMFTMTISNNYRWKLAQLLNFVRNIQNRVWVCLFLCFKSLHFDWNPLIPCVNCQALFHQSWDLYPGILTRILKISVWNTWTMNFDLGQ